jgi:hypothetical protein
MTLIGNILRNHLIGHITATTTKVAPRPQVPPLELLLQMGELAQQLVGRLPFQPLDQPTDRHLRGDRHEQLQMSFSHVAFPERYFMLSADLANPIAHPQGHFARQRWPAIFRGPDQMQMDFKNCVGTAPIRFHAAKVAYGCPHVLKLSPARRGRYPSHSETVMVR